MAIVPYLNAWFSYLHHLFTRFFRFEAYTGGISRAQLEARRAAIQAELEALNKEAIREKRRCDAMQRRAKEEGAKLGARVAEIKAVHGEMIPDHEWDILLDNFFAQWRAEDPPFFRNMFKIGFTEEPKPIQQPDNALDRLLTRGVEEKIIDPACLDEVICPLSYQVMQDPVKGEDGRTYDRFCLENIYYALPGTYPFNRQTMNVDPAALPCDRDCADKIEKLAKRASPPSIKSEESEHDATTPDMSL